MRIVVKVGSSTLTYKTGRFNLRFMEKFCEVLSDIKNQGHEIVLVSSGAIALGLGKLDLTERPDDMPSKQACAAVGQCELMYTYDKLFSEYGHTVGQILMTAGDVEDDMRKGNIRETIFRMLEMGIVPIINENDTLSTDEISLGDNDALSAIVSCLVGADLLVFLSDIDGLYSDDPRKNSEARIIRHVDEITDGMIEKSGGAGTSRGRGGMQTKIKAAKTCTENGIEVCLINGSYPNLLYKVIEGEDAGTRFSAKK